MDLKYKISDDKDWSCMQVYLCHHETDVYKNGELFKINIIGCNMFTFMHQGLHNISLKPQDFDSQKLNISNSPPPI